MKYDIIIVGASLGGLRAAISALDSGKKILMSEVTDWVGGQLTSQAVPPDEHPWIESQGGTRSYLNYRKRVRDYYRNLENASDLMKNSEKFCPGSSWVSRVAHEPVVAHKLLREEIDKYIENGMLTLLLNTEIESATYEGDFVTSVTFRNVLTNETCTHNAEFYLDGTDTGELLPLVNCEFSMGSESTKTTGEPHAGTKDDPFDMQPVTWVFALKMKDKLEKEDYIEKPKTYEYFKNKKTHYCNLNLFGWWSVNCHTFEPEKYGMFDKEINEKSLGLWSYRRIISKEHYKGNIDEVSLINWPMNDYDEAPVFGVKDYKKNREMAREQSLCFAYYLQNEAPNSNGGFGYPVCLCKEVMGTDDGLAKDIYIRESRRIKGIETIVEQNVSKLYNDGIKKYKNSVGVGHYAIDIHQTVVTHSTFYAPTYPFEIPLGAMIPIRMKNLIPACKNISCTHFTNGCYREHPTEWNVGEVAGLLAAFAIDKKCYPIDVNNKYFSEFEEIIHKYGVQNHWDESKMKL